MPTPDKDKDGCSPVPRDKSESAKADEAEGNSNLPGLLPEDKGDPGFLKKCMYVFGGLGLIVFGIVGWILPVLIGIPFIVGGLAMLSVAFKPLRKWVNYCEAKLPRSWRLYLRPRKKGAGKGAIEKEVAKFFPGDKDV